MGERARTQVRFRFLPCLSFPRRVSSGCFDEPHTPLRVESETRGRTFNEMRNVHDSLKHKVIKFSLQSLLIYVCVRERERERGRL